MPITVTCPTCHRTFRVGDHFAGRRGLCPDCGAVVTVPDAAPPQLDHLPDEPPPDTRPRRRREPPRRPTPRDHLPAWRRVSIGYLIQQLATVLSLIGLLLVSVGSVLLADDPGDLNAEPNEAQGLVGGLGMLALFLGLVGLVIGRLVSASTPVRAPRALGILSAVATLIQLLGFCLLGFLFVAMEVEAQQGNPPNPLLEVVGGLCLFGWLFVAVGGESVHGFAVGSVGRVLRADGARALGNALGVLVAVVGLLGAAAFFVICVWVGGNNPQNPEPTEEQSLALLVWAGSAGGLTGLYWLADLVLLQLGRSAIARIAAGADDQAGPDDRWD